MPACGGSVKPRCGTCAERSVRTCPARPLLGCPAPGSGAVKDPRARCSPRHRPGGLGLCPLGRRTAWPVPTWSNCTHRARPLRPRSSYVVGTCRSSGNPGRDATRGPPSASRGSRLRGARIWSVAPRLPGVLCHAQSTRSPRARARDQGPCRAGPSSGRRAAPPPGNIMTGRALCWAGGAI